MSKAEMAIKEMELRDIMDNHKLRAENARLRAELEALKPVPYKATERVLYGCFRNGSEMEYGSKQDKQSNLKLTLWDGKLVKAEII